MAPKKQTKENKESKKPTRKKSSKTSSDVKKQDTATNPTKTDNSTSFVDGTVNVVQNSVFFSNFVTAFLILILMFTMFALGSLWQRVTFYETGGANLAGQRGVANPTQPNQPTQPSQPSAPSPLGNLSAIVEQIGVDVDAFETCVNEGRYVDNVQAEYEEGIDAGVQGTPGNFLVNLQTGDTILIPGAVPFAGPGGIQENIDKLLSGDVDDSELSPTSPADISSDDHVRGSENPTIALIEYSDYECPFCARFHTTAQQAVDTYSDELVWVYRHFPLDQIHPNARPAAEASECVAEIGGNDKFWEFTDLIFSSF